MVFHIKNFFSKIGTSFLYEQEILDINPSDSKLIKKIENNILEWLDFIFTFKDKESYKYKVVYKLHNKKYYLWLIVISYNKILWLYTINEKNRIIGKWIIKNLWYNILKYIIANTNENTVEVFNILSEAKNFWDKSVERLYNEWIIKDFEFHNVKNKKNSEYICYEKIILYKK